MAGSKQKDSSIAGMRNQQWKSADGKKVKMVTGQWPRGHRSGHLFEDFNLEVTAVRILNSR